MKKTPELKADIERHALTMGGMAIRTLILERTLNSFNADVDKLHSSLEHLEPEDFDYFEKIRVLLLEAIDFCEKDFISQADKCPYSFLF